MIVVPDASVVLKWFLQRSNAEPDSEQALALLTHFVEGRQDLLVPVHCQAEVCAVLARLAPERASDDLRDLLELDIPVRHDGPTLARAMELSAELDHHLFDTLYHAVALQESNTLLVTADTRYERKARPLGQIVLLRDWDGGAVRS